ncbi:MAG: HupE/UreJ family protein [Acidobacteriota bacterium]
MSLSSKRLLLICALASAAHAHVVSMSTGELRVTGKTATYELRMPAFEIPGLSNPEVSLLNEVRFGDARRTSSECKSYGDSLVCRATYEFPQPIPDKVEVQCTLYRVTVPNHIHMLYAVQGENGDQKVFDQSKSVLEMRFHPPSVLESLARDGSAGALLLLRSVAGLLFLAVLALAARTTREAILLTAAFLVSEWLVRPAAPFLPLSMPPEFLEAVMALTVVYMAGELILLPAGRARWVIVPLLGLVHGLPFAAFPPLYLGGASATQALLLAVLFYMALKLPGTWRKPAAGLLAVLAGAWFARLLMA